jgi:carbon-monoxide dehydrogenase medium subunit
LHDFDYIKAKSIDQASTALLDQPTNSSILAGGTDLVDQMRRGVKTPDLIVDIKSIPELQRVALKENALILGGGVPVSRIYNQQGILSEFPGLETSLRLIGSIQIQNRATIAGNIGNASPSADLVPILVALESKATIATGNSKREIEIEKLITEPGIIATEPGELIENINIPLPKGKSTNSYLRFTPRAEMDIAVVSLGVSIELEPDATIVHCKIALGAVTPKPIRALDAEQYMLGKRLNIETVKEAAFLINQSAAPISDIRASAQYRLELLPVIGERAIRSCAINLGISL